MLDTLVLLCGCVVKSLCSTMTPYCSRYLQTALFSHFWICTIVADNIWIIILDSSILIVILLVVFELLALDQLQERVMNKDIQLEESLGYREAGLHSYLVRCYLSLQFTTPTPIQYYSIHSYLSRRCSMVGQSKSGTGKTLSYISIMLSHILAAPALTPSCHYLIVLPTRQLTLQVYQRLKEIVGCFTHVKPEGEQERLARQKLKQIRLLMSIGGIPFEDDRKKYLQEGGNVFVGTVGRTLEFIEKKLVRVADLRMVVLDEGDKLFQSKNRKFSDVLDQVMTVRDEHGFKVEFLLFSATLTNALLQQITTKRAFVFVQTVVDSEGTLKVKITEEVKDVASEVGEGESVMSLQNIKKYKLPVQQENASYFNSKMAALIQLLRELSYQRCLVFVEKKTLLEQINERLTTAGLQALLIHGSLSQSSRIKLMNQVNHSNIILASDLLARGIDIELDLVILFDAKNNDTFWHRIGRTGRYNKMGVAISLDDIQGWQIYDKPAVQAHLAQIAPTFNNAKEWYGKYLTEIGTWNQTSIEKEMQSAQEYRYFDEQLGRKKRKEESEAKVTTAKDAQASVWPTDDELKIKSMAELRALVSTFLNCNKCTHFMDSIQELTKYRFQLKHLNHHTQ